MSADRILRPLWEAGGLRGTNPAEAYYIRCDDTLNTPSVIAVRRGADGGRRGAGVPRRVRRSSASPSSTGARSRPKSSRMA